MVNVIRNLVTYCSLVKKEGVYWESLTVTMSDVPLIFPMMSVKLMTEGPSFSDKNETKTQTPHFNFQSRDSSFSYRIERCSDSSMFLIREKTHTRTYDTPTNFLYQVTRTNFFHEKLGLCDIGLSVWFTILCNFCQCTLGIIVCSNQQKDVVYEDVACC